MRMNVIYDRKENENGGVGSESSKYIKMRWLNLFIKIFIVIL